MKKSNYFVATTELDNGVNVDHKDTIDELARGCQFDTPLGKQEDYVYINKKYYFTKRGYERIIDYAVKHHMVYPNEADRWRKEAGLLERN